MLRSEIAQQLALPSSCPDARVFGAEAPFVEFVWLQYLKQRGNDRLQSELDEFGVHAFFAIVAVREVDVSGTHDFW